MQPMNDLDALDASPAHLDTFTFSGARQGVKLVVLGAVHGNETCGTQAIHRLIGELKAGAVCIIQGSLTLVPIANPRAYARGQRHADRNLNRSMKYREIPRNYEDHVANVLCPLLAQNDVLLDLHSFQGEGRPFVMLGPRDNQESVEAFARAGEEEWLAMHLGPSRIVEGWMTAYTTGVSKRFAATNSDAEIGEQMSNGIGTTEFMRAAGGYGVTLECGPHSEPNAPAVAYRAIRQTLALLGLEAEAPEPPCANFELLRLVEVVDRHDPADAFTQVWASYDAVVASQAIGVRSTGEIVRAPRDGYVVFPNEKAPRGSEWFYFAEASRRPLTSRR